jgi:predicted DNA-binding transcriptional regulator AlpA
MVKPTDLERLRIGAAGDLLGVSRQRIQQLIRAERFPKPDVNDKVGPIWNRETIEEWADQQWWGRYRWRTAAPEAPDVELSSRSGRKFKARP